MILKAIEMLFSSSSSASDHDNDEPFFKKLFLYASECNRMCLRTPKISWGRMPPAPPRVKGYRMALLSSLVPRLSLLGEPGNGATCSLLEQAVCPPYISSLDSLDIMSFMPSSFYRVWDTVIIKSPDGLPQVPTLIISQNLQVQQLIRGSHPSLHEIVEKGLMVTMCHTDTKARLH